MVYVMYLLANGNIQCRFLLLFVLLPKPTLAARHGGGDAVVYEGVHPDPGAPQQRPDARICL
jgi:hypothetical protein